MNLLIKSYKRTPNTIRVGIPMIKAIKNNTSILDCLKLIFYKYTKGLSKYEFP